MGKNTKIIWFLLFIISILLNLYFLNLLNKNKTEETFVIKDNNITKNNFSPEQVLTLDNGSIVLNTFKDSYEEFLKLNSYNDYKNWYNKFWNDLFIWFLIKLNDLDSYKKFWLYQYEYYISKKNAYFLKNMQEKNISNGNEFVDSMSIYFSKIKDIKKLSEVNYEGDIFVIYNSLSIQDALIACEKLKNDKPLEYWNDSNSCEDKAYIFRATKENKYCEKVSDTYKTKLCNDFLNYQNK